VDSYSFCFAVILQAFYHSQSAASAQVYLCQIVCSHSIVIDVSRCLLRLFTISLVRESVLFSQWNKNTREFASLNFRTSYQIMVMLLNLLIHVVCLLLFALPTANIPTFVFHFENVI
jgi:hypothetical protein